MVLQKPGGSGDQRRLLAGLRVVLAGYGRQGGSLDRLSGPQNICCLQGWSIHNTPGYLGVEKERLES